MTPTPRIRRRPLAIGTALAAGLALLAGCTAAAAPAPLRDPIGAAGRFQLVSFDSCADALAGLRSAAKAYVGPYGFGGNDRILAAAGDVASAVAPNAGTAERSAADSAPEYSGTNNHESGVDEPDLVKTDGQRIVTVSHGVLRVVDPAARRVTGRLDLDSAAPGQIRWAAADLLLHGDRALVLIRDGWGMPAAEVARPPALPPAAGTVGPRLLLVDLAGSPRVLSDYRIDGMLVDARQVGATARVVVRSSPRLVFPYKDKATDAERVARNRQLIDASAVDDWLPRYEVTSDGRTSTGRVGCDQVSRPATYSGTSMVTLLSFDLAAPALSDGEPVTVLADGDTVYSNGRNLYVANDQRWRLGQWRPGGNAPFKPADEITEIYQFDTSGPGRPRYVAAASVPGWLINQYAMSEWDGYLRVATTSGQAWGDGFRSSSSVYALRADGRTLHETGRVTGLGKGERIYAVRFAGATGYVVTFRQTDPLYTVDFRDPARPRLAGELKITGYSTYLHPLDGGRLIGVGQEASTAGRVQGIQISLFDVTVPTKPTRLAQHHVRAGQSEAEYDPHAFLYWPVERLLVVPLTVYGDQGSFDAPSGKPLPRTGAVALRVGDGGFTEVGMIAHPPSTGHNTHGSTIRRSLVVDGVLWTVSDLGLMATDTSTMDTLRWLPN